MTDLIKDFEFKSYQDLIVSLGNAGWSFEEIGKFVEAQVELTIQSESRKAVEEYKKQNAPPVKMVRPEWNWILENLTGKGIVPCSCQQMLWTVEEMREHWQKGHFDKLDSPKQLEGHGE